MSFNPGRGTAANQVILWDGVKASWASPPQVPATNFFFSGQTQGDLTYFDGTEWNRLPAGTSGNILRTQGAGANPQWTNQIVLSSETHGDLVYRNSSLWTRLPAGTPGQILTTQGTTSDPLWANNSASDNGFASRTYSKGLMTLPSSVPVFTGNITLPSALQSLDFDGRYLYTIDTSANTLKIIDAQTSALVSTQGLNSFSQGNIGTAKQVLYLGDSQATPGGKMIAIAGTSATTTFVVDPVTYTLTTSQWWGAADTRGLYFDGVNLFCVALVTSTWYIVVYTGVLKAGGSIISGTLGYQLFSPIQAINSNGFSPVLTSDGTNLWMIDQRGSGGTFSLYKIPLSGLVSAFASVSTFTYSGTDDPRCICFDGRYLWVGINDGTNPPRLQVLDPTLSNPLNSIVADHTLKQESPGTLTSSSSIDYVAFDGRRILCSLSGTTTTSQKALFAVDPDVFIVDDDITSNNFFGNQTTICGASTGFNAPKGIAVGHEGGINSSVYVVDTLGIHKAYDPPILHVGHAYLSAGQIINTTTITSAYTILPSDYLIRCNQTAALTVTLPANPRAGQTFIVKDVSASGANTFNISVSPNGGTIDGSGSNKVISTARGVLRLTCGSATGPAWDTI